MGWPCVCGWYVSHLLTGTLPDGRTATLCEQCWDKARAAG